MLLQQKIYIFVVIVTNKNCLKSNANVIQIKIDNSYLYRRAQLTEIYQHRIVPQNSMKRE